MHSIKKARVLMSKTNLEKLMGAIIFTLIFVFTSISTILNKDEKTNNENEIFKTATNCEKSQPGCHCALPDDDDDSKIA